MPGQTPLTSGRPLERGLQDKQLARDRKLRMRMPVHREDEPRRQVERVGFERSATNAGSLSVQGQFGERLAVCLVVPRNPLVVGHRRAAALACLDKEASLVKMVLLVAFLGSTC